MKKQLTIIFVMGILLTIGLSGCFEEEGNSNNKSIFIGKWHGNHFNCTEFFNLTFFTNGSVNTIYSSNVIYWANYSIESGEICFNPNPFQELPKINTESVCFVYEFDDIYLILNGHWHSYIFEKVD